MEQKCGGLQQGGRHFEVQGAFVQQAPFREPACGHYLRRLEVELISISWADFVSDGPRRRIAPATPPPLGIKRSLAEQMKAASKKKNLKRVEMDALVHAKETIDTTIANSRKLF